MFADDPGSYTQPRSYWKSVVALVTHLAGTAVIFTAFIFLGWIVGFFLYWLNSIHPFADDVLRLITRIELGFIYADAALCSVVLFAGILRFCKDIVGARS